MSDEVRPQLGRICYSVDSDSDDSSSSSLEILPPVTGRDDNEQRFSKVEKGANEKSNANGIMKKMKTQSESSFAKMMAELSDSSEEDDLDRHRPAFAQSIQREQLSTHVISNKKSNNDRSSYQRARQSKRPRSSSDDISQNESLRQEERTRKKVEKERLKRQTKLARQLQRVEERLTRTREKEAGQRKRKEERIQTQQASGKFASDEVVLLIDPIIHRDNRYGLVSCLEEDYKIQEYPSDSTYKKTIQWIRRDYLQGGASEACRCLLNGQKDQLKQVSHLVILVDFDDYIPLIDRIEHDVDDDYPKLEEWITALIRQWQARWSTEEEPRVTIVLNQVSEVLDQKWTLHRLQQSTEHSISTSLPSDWELRDSLQWLLVQFRVDCIQCSSTTEIQSTIKMFTRAISEAPYVNQATELECVRKIKPAVDVAEDDPFSKAQDTWSRQLQMIPGISETRARNLVQQYPTMQSLWRAYKEGDESSNFALLSQSFGSSNQMGLSTTIYRVMSLNNPQELL